MSDQNTSPPLYAARHPSALTFSFSLSILQLGFKMSQKVFPPGSLNFKADIEHLLPLLPVKEGEVVRTDTLMEVIVQAARELGMEWWNHFRERAGVVFGVMHAGMIQRKWKEYRMDDGVSEALGSMELGMDEGAVFERLAEELEDALKVKI
ncbi:hypothetical protein N0V83_009860 [Neocucurbitaria cava]|uniref:Uncharacterized protein n=1 Tax=Neocucurbitaria cava TaxID=798079 RepID=A0A9W8Y107_9PLEO|nr:hypothetical protein N0V83_009860 [Neocucurbitaria cava]